MQKLPLETQTLYAELMEHLTALEARRTIGRLSGCFTSKTVKGESYYYFQYSDPGGASRQIYVGKKTPSLDSVVERHRAERGVLRTDSERIQRLCALVRTGGALVADAASARVLRALAESGAFHLGAVLVGTHAFAVLGNLLGVRWESAALKTHDIDIASEAVMRVAMPADLQADVPGVLERLEMGFLPRAATRPEEPFHLVQGAGPIPSRRYPDPGGKGEGGEAGPRTTLERGGPARAFSRLPDRGFQARGRCGRWGRSGQRSGPGEVCLPQADRVPGASGRDAREGGEGYLAGRAGVLRAGRRASRDLLLAWDGIARRGRGWERRVRAGLGLMKKRHSREYEMLVGIVPNLERN